MNFLFVCTGNTCRSPMAEQIFRYLAMMAGVDAECSSAGLSAQDGLNASVGAAEALMRMGLSVDEHVSRRLGTAMLAQADVVLAMETWHRDAMIRQHPNYAKKVFLLKEYAGAKGDIADPFGGDPEEYDACADELRHAIESIIDNLS